MKKLLICCLAMAYINVVNAQSTNSLAMAHPVAPMATYNMSMTRDLAGGYQPADPAYYKRWHRLKTLGIVLTGVGVGCITASVLAAKSSDEVYNDPVSGGATDRYVKDQTVSALGIAGGIVAIAGGVTMWAIGGNRLKKLKHSVSIIGTNRGVGLACGLQYVSWLSHHLSSPGTRLGF